MLNKYIMYFRAQIMPDVSIKGNRDVKFIGQVKYRISEETDVMYLANGAEIPKAEEGILYKTGEIKTRNNYKN